jgi:hypothetical protein
MVHKSYTNPSQLAVVAVFFDVDSGGNTTNPFIQALNITLL